MCGGFTCSKNALIALNILYIVVSFMLIGVATYPTTYSDVSNVSVIGGIIACGVFLFILSLVGLIGALKHQQVLLFFYMIILFLLFVIQFSIACACLAVTQDQQHELAKTGWEKASDSIRENAQKIFNCCGFEETNSTEKLECPKMLKCCAGGDECDSCPKCWVKLRDALGSALKICGGIGLFFSFTEFLGVWLTIHYRNQKDPRANPKAFL